MFLFRWYHFNSLRLNPPFVDQQRNYRPRQRAVRDAFAFPVQLAVPVKCPYHFHVYTMMKTTPAVPAHALSKSTVLRSSTVLDLVIVGKVASLVPPSVPANTSESAGR